MNSLKASVMAETLVIGPCQSCQRPLQRKTEIVTCKNGGHQACATCTEPNQGVCNNCATVASTKFDQGYLEKLNLPQLRQIMRAVGMPVKNDVFQTQPMIDAILEYKNDPAAAKAKWAAKSGAGNTQSAMFIKKGAPRTNIIIISESDKSAGASLKSPTTPKSPGPRSPLSPSATNGEYTTTSPSATSPRKTSVNVGNYYERQKSNDMPDTPKGSVSQLRQSFENAANANNKAVDYGRSTSNSGKKQTPTSPTVIESVRTEEKIEHDDVIDASINGYQEEEQPHRHDDNDDDNQSEHADESHQSEYHHETIDDEQHDEPESIHDEPEIDHDEPEVEEVEEPEVEEPEQEEENPEPEQEEDNSELERGDENREPEVDEIEDNDASASSEVADAVEEIEQEINENLKDQVEEIIAETTDKVEDEE